jgi:hypothetical protein
MTQSEQMPHNELAAAPDGSGDYVVSAINQVINTMNSAGEQHAVPAVQLPEKVALLGAINEVYDEQKQAELAFGRRLEALGADVEEVVQEAERIKHGAAQLIETFKIRPEFFDDTSRSTIFTSLALSAAKTQEQLDAGEGNSRELERKRSFIASAAFLLTRDYADGFPELAERHKTEKHGEKGGVTKSKLDDFEQPELTSSLRDFIEREGLLNELRGKIGVGGAEPEYHVLSIGRGADTFFASAPNGLAYRELREWSNGLEERTERFAESINGGGLVADASGFAIDFPDNPGMHYVYIPAISAELLMAEERGIVAADRVAQTNKNPRTVATIKHEYVHTQGGLIVEDEFGKSLDERRAEYYSGDENEYYEVKVFFRQLQILNKGKFIGDIFDEALPDRNKPGHAGTYELIAKHYGLEAVAEIAAAQPDAYVQYATSSFTHDMLQALGGYDAIIERMARQSDAEGMAEARRRTARVINNFRAERISEDGQLDQDHEQFIGVYFAPLLRGLNLHLPDIPYEVPTYA